MEIKIVSKENKEIQELLNRRIEMYDGLFDKEEKNIDGVDYISLKISKDKNIKIIRVFLMDNFKNLLPFTFFENNNFEILINKDISEYNKSKIIIINYNMLRLPISLEGKYLSCIESVEKDKLNMYIIEENQDIIDLRNGDELQYPRIETKTTITTKENEDIYILNSSIILDPDTSITIFNQQINENVQFIVDRINKVFNYNLHEIIDIISGKELLYSNGNNLLKIKGYDPKRNGLINIKKIILSRDTNYNILYEDLMCTFIDLLDNSYTLVDCPDRLIYQNNILNFKSNKYDLCKYDIDKYVNCYNKLQFISNLLAEVAEDEICDLLILKTYKMQLEEYMNDDDIYNISENIFAMIDDYTFKINELKNDINNLLDVLNKLIDINTEK